MNDQNIIKLVRDIDASFDTYAESYGISALSLAAVILGRLKLLSEFADCADDFDRLLLTVMNTKRPENKITLQ